MILGIYGVGGFGSEVNEIAQRINNIKNKWTKIYFVDDNIVNSNKINNSSIIIDFNKFRSMKEGKEMVIAVGEPSTREILYKRVAEAEIAFGSLHDPTSIVSDSANIGEGVIIAEYTTIHANVRIGENSVVQPFCCMGHDISVGNHSVISTTANVGGGTIIGDRVYLGMNCSILQNLQIGDDAIVAMGAAVFRDVEPNMIVMGNPARVTKRNESNKVFVNNKSCARN